MNEIPFGSGMALNFLLATHRKPVAKAAYVGSNWGKSKYPTPPPPQPTKNKDMQSEMQRHKLTVFSDIAALGKYRRRPTIKFNCA